MQIIACQVPYLALPIDYMPATNFVYVWFQVSGGDSTFDKVNTIKNYFSWRHHALHQVLLSSIFQADTRQAGAQGRGRGRGQGRGQG